MVLEDLQLKLLIMIILWLEILQIFHNITPTLTNILWISTFTRKLKKRDPTVKITFLINKTNQSKTPIFFYNNNNLMFSLNHINQSNNNKLNSHLKKVSNLKTARLVDPVKICCLNFNKQFNKIKKISIHNYFYNNNNKRQQRPHLPAVQKIWKIKLISIKSMCKHKKKSPIKVKIIYYNNSNNSNKNNTPQAHSRSTNKSTQAPNYNLNNNKLNNNPTCSLLRWSTDLINN